MKKTYTLAVAMWLALATASAQQVEIDRSGWRITAYSSATTNIENAADGRVEAAIDGNASTWYHSDWSGSQTGKGMPQAFLIDMAEEHDLTGFNYQGRTDKVDGTKPTAWRVYLYNEESEMPFGGFDRLTGLAGKDAALSTDALGTPAAEGNWSWTGSSEIKTFEFTEQKRARYILFVADATVTTDADWLTCAEFNALQTAPSISVDATTGTFSQLPGTSSTWAALWTSTEKEPEMTVSVDRNNMKAGDGGIQMYTGLNNKQNTYTIAVAPGYRILGYDLEFANDVAANVMTVTPAEGGEAVTAEGSEVSTVGVRDILRKSTSFSIACEQENKGILVKRLQVYYTPYDENSLERTKLFDTETAEIPYRIPAIAATSQTGRLIAVNGYLVCGTDIGYGQVDLHYRVSEDNGASWSDTMVMAEGNGIKGDPKCGYGDPAIVADCENDNDVLVISVTGNTIYAYATRENPNRIARHYSHDGGLTWDEPEEITEDIYTLFDEGNVVQSMFVGSGKICQSKTVKVGSHYRLYAALCAKPNGNRVIYSDDFGKSWKALGGASALPVPSGDEPKCEELPDGRVLISSRCGGGRYYNIYSFTNTATAEGEWGEQTYSSSSNKGIAIGGNSTNGEILIVPAVRNEDGAEVYVALQSVPMAASRSNVGIFYKELAAADDWQDEASFAGNWDGAYQVSTTTSAYSTMCLQKDDKIGFFFEENYRYIGKKDGHNNDGYDGIYTPISLEQITDKAYSVKRDISRRDILKAYFSELMEGAGISEALKAKLREAIDNLSDNPTYQETDAIRNFLQGIDPDQTDFTPEMKAALEKARALLGMTGVGYPSATAAERATLDEAVAKAEQEVNAAADISREMVEEMNASIDDFVATDDIQLPEEGKTYTITCVAKSGLRSYMYYDAANDCYNLAATDETTNAGYPATAKLTCSLGQEAGKFNFRDADGRYLVYRGATTGGSSNGYNANKGYAPEYAQQAELTVEKLKGANVSAKAEEIFGRVAMWGVRNDPAKKGYFVVKNATAYDGAGDAYYNDTFSSALLLEETELPDGIGRIGAETTATSLYDLQGRRVEQAGKGIYIAAGKKIIVK